MMKLIDPLKQFGSELNSVQSPSRYIGGEYALTVKPHSGQDDFFNVGIAFPDLYEIAMSNLAVKIIYNGLNALDGIRCERVFAPDTDFEAFLKQRKVPLYTLETGMPLKNLDMLAFSIGYELGITEVLAMLETGGISLTVQERTEDEPLVIAGGCGVTNPAPFADFFDAVMIGEAEDELFNLTKELRDLKKNGASRKQLLAHIESKPYMWTRNSCSEGKKIARRSVQGNFGLVPSVPSWYPIPSIKPVQDHGVVEIMRGCPNGCRFCHAGIYYRPTRVKNLKLIIDEIDHLVFDAGYREISLNSLSSADFPDVEGLLDLLNKRYEGYNVSFQLPSLKVNSMSLGILEKLSAVRKSGLTFAVETPEELWQLSLNKEVYAQHLEDIVRQAKAAGWTTAKFYFMIGLPLGDYFAENQDSLAVGSEGSEEKVIVDFLLNLQARTRIQCNVNVGIFIPKPHTAYQWVTQITPERAQKKMEWIFQNLPRGKFRLGRHNYDATILEGLISRGNFDTGKVILDAYKRGARFDAWDDHLRENMQFWNEAFDNAVWDVKKWIFKKWDLNESLPWDGVSLGTSKAFFKNEWKKSLSHELTKRCASDCDHKCGICNSKEKVSVHTKEEIESVSTCIKNKTVAVPKQHPESNIPILYRVVFNFTRTGGGEYIAYLAQVESFHKAILRSGLPFVFSSGFNPLPRIEFATAMTLGIPSEEETASCCLYSPVDEDRFKEVMNSVLPQSFRVTDVMIFPVTTLRKRESLSQGLWGCIYKYTSLESFDLRAFLSSQEYKILREQNSQIKTEWKEDSLFVTSPSSDKAFRTALEAFCQKKWYEVCRIVKTATLAKPQISGWTARDEQNWRCDNKNFKKDETLLTPADSSPVPFMELYAKIAAINAELIDQREQMNELKNANTLDDNNLPH